VFDESVYPFESLHPNAGARIRNDVLLLPEDLLNPSNEGVGCTDSYAANDHYLLSESDVQNFSGDGLQQSSAEPQAHDAAPDPRKICPGAPARDPRQIRLLSPMMREPAPARRVGGGRRSHTQCGLSYRDTWPDRGCSRSPWSRPFARIFCD